MRADETLEDDEGEIMQRGLRGLNGPTRPTLPPAPTLGPLLGGTQEGGHLLEAIRHCMARLRTVARSLGVRGGTLRLTPSNGATLRRRDRPSFESVEGIGEPLLVLHGGQAHVRVAHALLGRDFQG